MKRKDLAELRTKETKDLSKMLGEKQIELEKIRVNIRAGKEKNLKKAGNLRRDISQILTLISEKKILEEEAKVV